MAVNTKIDLFDGKVEQCSGEVLHLSGCTHVYGEFLIQSGGTISILDNAAAGKVLTSDINGLGTWEIISQSITGGTNGLCLIGQNITLGGKLTGNTCVDINGHDFSIVGDISHSFMCFVDSTCTATFGSDVAAGINIFQGTCGCLTMSLSGAVFTDNTIPTPMGLQYASDYSAGYTCLSIPNAGWVTGQTSTVSACNGLTKVAGVIAFGGELTGTTDIYGTYDLTFGYLTPLNKLCVCTVDTINLNSNAGCATFALNGTTCNISFGTGLAGATYISIDGSTTGVITLATASNANISVNGVYDCITLTSIDTKAYICICGGSVDSILLGTCENVNAVIDGVNNCISLCTSAGPTVGLNGSTDNLVLSTAGSGGGAINLYGTSCNAVCLNAGTNNNNIKIDGSTNVITLNANLGTGVQTGCIEINPTGGYNKSCVINSSGYESIVSQEYNRLLISGATDFKGAEYGDNFHSKFTARSLVDADYVTGGTLVLSANNGLTKLGTRVVLGGALTGSTNIDITGGTIFTISGFTGILGAYNQGLQIDQYTTSLGDYNFGAGGKHYIKVDYNGTIIHHHDYLNRCGDIFVDGTFVCLATEDSYGVNSKYSQAAGSIGMSACDPTAGSHAFCFSLAACNAGLYSVDNCHTFNLCVDCSTHFYNSNGIRHTETCITPTDVIIGGTGAFGGAHYCANYAANFTDRSLVDKAWVLTQISGTTGSTTESSGENVTKLICQASHGFTVGEVIGWSGGSYNKAIASGSYDGEVLGIVSKCYNADCFSLTQAGYVTGLTSLSTNSTYFLSPTTAGLITTVEPSGNTQISKTVLIANSSTTAWVLPYAGYVISTGATGGGGFADNGLSMNGNTTELGGTIYKNTCIDNGGFLFAITGNSGNFILDGVSNIQTLGSLPAYTNSPKIIVDGNTAIITTCLNSTQYTTLSYPQDAYCVHTNGGAELDINGCSGVAMIKGSCVQICGNSFLATTPADGVCTDKILVWNSTDCRIYKLPYSSGSTGAASLSEFTITGNSSATGFTVNHAKNKQFVAVEVVRNSSPYDTIYTTVQRPNANCICVTFDTAPATGQQYKILITA